MQGEESVTPGLTLHTEGDASLSPHPSGPTGLTREENAEAWEVWSQGQPPTPEAGSRSRAWLGGTGWDTFWKNHASSPRGQGHWFRTTDPILECDTLSGTGGPAQALPPARAHPVFTYPDQGIGCCGGGFIMMIILTKFIYWHVTYTKRGEIVSAQLNESSQSEHTLFKK